MTSKIFQKTNEKTVRISAQKSKKLSNQTNKDILTMYRGLTLSKASRSKRQDLPKLGLFLQNIFKICISSSVGFNKTWGLPNKSGQNISSSVVFTKTRAFPNKSGQNISSCVGFTKTRAFPNKSGQNISSSVGFTKTK